MLTASASSAAQSAIADGRWLKRREFVCRTPA
jgi:hypothetical protein